MHRHKKGEIVDKQNPRNSVLQDGQLRDKETLQKLFYYTHVCTVFKVKLLQGVQFSKSEAQTVMNKHLKKRQAHGTMNILEDRFKLMKQKTGKEPFRSWLSYREIDDVNVSTQKPEYFVLSVNSDQSFQRYYEVYKCKTKENSRQLVEYFRKAMSDPEFRIRDKDYIGTTGVETDGRKSHLPLDEFEDVEEDESSPESSPILEHPYSKVAEVRSSPPPPIRYSPVTVVKSQPAMVRSSPPPRRLQSQENLRDLQDVTYIGMDPYTKEPRIDKGGSVYLYMQRFDEGVKHNPKDREGSGFGVYEYSSLDSRP